MKEHFIEVEAMTEREAAKFTAENKNGYVWPVGLYVIIDNERSVLESKAEADELIERITKARDELWRS